MALARYFTRFLSRASSQTDTGVSFPISCVTIKNETALAADICNPELRFRASGALKEINVAESSNQVCSIAIVSNRFTACRAARKPVIITRLIVALVNIY